MAMMVALMRSALAMTKADQTIDAKIERKMRLRLLLNESSSRKSLFFTNAIYCFAHPKFHVLDSESAMRSHAYGIPSMSSLDR